ncbi:MAG: outer membrane beta-barrel protein [Vicinamibacterales bacterium]
MGLLALPAESRAQGAVGTGPLTASLTDVEPTTGVLRVGPIRLAPGITISQIGVDSNIFHEAENPKEDFIASAKPDLAIFTRLRFIQVSAYTGIDATYFKKYTDERSWGYAGRARVDILLSRLFPFVGYGETKTRERPNSEIDVRADSVQTEKSAGLGFRLSETSSVYVSANRMTTRYQGAVEEGVDLGQSLNRHGDDFNGGLRTALTPLTTLTLRAGYKQDLFTGDATRNSDSRYATIGLAFAPQAVITGAASIGYQDSRPADPKVEPFRGMTATASISYALLELGRINFSAARSTEYSFDAADAYFLSNIFNLSYTHRLLGDLDAQIQGSRALSDYGYREGTVPRRDTTDTVSGGLGYNLRNRTRVALSYEYSRRRSLELPEQNYEGRRVFLSWTYAF